LKFYYYPLSLTNKSVFELVCHRRMFWSHACGNWNITELLSAATRAALSRVLADACW
jgi:hypothetical protein